MRLIQQQSDHNALQSISVEVKAIIPWLHTNHQLFEVGAVDGCPSGRHCAIASATYLLMPGGSTTNGTTGTVKESVSDSTSEVSDAAGRKPELTARDELSLEGPGSSGLVSRPREGLFIREPRPESRHPEETIQLVLCMPTLFLCVRRKLLRIHLRVDDVLYEVTSLLTPLQHAVLQQQQVEAALLNHTHASPSQGEGDPALAAVRAMSGQWTRFSSCFSLDLRGVEAGPHLLQAVAGLYPLQPTHPDIPTAKQTADIVGFDAVRITRL